jgi:hypothetical protein
VGVRAMVEEAMRGLWCCLLRGFRKCRVPLVSWESWSGGRRLGFWVCCARDLRLEFTVCSGTIYCFRYDRCWDTRLKGRNFRQGIFFKSNFDWKMWKISMKSICLFSYSNSLKFMWICKFYISFLRYLIKLLPIRTKIYSNSWIEI